MSEADDINRLRVKAERRVRELEEKLTKLRFALYVYGGHAGSCPGRPCDCGFKKAWDAAELPATFGDVMRISKLNALHPELPQSDRGSEQ